MASRVLTTVSDTRLIESMPCSTRKVAKSGKSDGAWPQMPILRPRRLAVAITILINAFTASLRSL